MKTKLLVAALALPLAFSACTQDEFENAQNNGTQIPDNAIKGLVLNVQKSAEGDGADTRGIWQNDKINFEKKNTFIRIDMDRHAIRKIKSACICDYFLYGTDYHRVRI